MKIKYIVLTIIVVAVSFIGYSIINLIKITINT